MEIRCDIRTAFTATKKYANRRLLVFCTVVSACFPVRAQKIFDPQKLHEIRIYTSAADRDTWFSLLQEYYDAALAGQPHRFIPVTAVMDGDSVPDVGLRFKGRYSNYGFPGKKKPFRLDFNEFRQSGSFQGLKKVNLHNQAGDPSFLREYMSYALFAHLGVAAPRASFCRLYVNDAYWGCYGVVEEPDKTFLKNRFGNKSGNLFECIKDTDLEWRGNDGTLYPEMELKTDPRPDAWNRLLAFVELFNHSSGYDYHQRLSALFDIESYLDILAVDVLINNWDSYYDNGRNFFIYDDPVYGKLRWIPWDYNLSFWATDPYVIPRDGSATGYKPLIFSLRNHPYLRRHYLENYCRVIEYRLNSFPFEERAEQAYGLIREAVEADTMKFYSNGVFHRNRTESVTVNMLRNHVPTDVTLPGVVALYRKRRNDLRKMLFVEGADCSEVPETDNVLHSMVFPNPTDRFFTVYLEETDIPSVRLDIRVFDAGGRTVLHETKTADAGGTTCDAGTCAPGMYVVEVRAGALKNRHKLIIRN